MNYKQLFLSKFKIDSDEALDNYIKFCISQNKGARIGSIKEAHHILPKNKKGFPEHKRTKENIVHLTFEDHIRAHIMLYDAIKTHENCAAVVRTLGNMTDVREKQEELIQIAAEARKIYREFMNSEKNPHIGRKRSEETKRKIKEGQARRDKSTITREKFIWITNGEIDSFHDIMTPIPEGWYPGRGRIYREKSSLSKIGTKQSEETIKKRSEAMKELGERHHMKDESKREERRLAWKTDNPSQKESNRLKSSERISRQLKDPVFLQKIKESALKKRGQINIYNHSTEEFARAFPNQIPKGFVDATGIWEWDTSSGKRKRRIKDVDQ